MARRYGGRKGTRKIDFAGIIQNGENSRDPEYGFVAQTANGTAMCKSLGWNRKDQQFPETAAREGGAWAKGSNRSGE